MSHDDTHDGASSGGWNASLKKQQPNENQRTSRIILGTEKMEHVPGRQNRTYGVPGVRARAWAQAGPRSVGSRGAVRCDGHGKRGPEQGVPEGNNKMSMQRQQGATADGFGAQGVRRI